MKPKNLFFRWGKAKPIKESICIIIYSLLFFSCSDEISPAYDFPDFLDVEEMIIDDNLEFPAGLSMNNGKTKFATSNELKGILIEAPSFLNLHSNGGIQLNEDPVIVEYRGTIDNITTSPIAEISLSDYFFDFDSPDYHALEDSLWRSQGLAIDGLVLNDGSILCSSNSSDKIFLLNSLGEVEVFAQDEELSRITDIIQGSDGKIYAVQAPLLDINNNMNVIFPKRVVSLEDKTISTEFVLPTSPTTSFSLSPEERIYTWWNDESRIHKLKIVENSLTGKEKYGAEFYISDLLGCTIYKVNSEREIEVLASGLQFPSSLAVDTDGNIFYTTTPLGGRSGYNLLTYKAGICMLNPETGDSKLVYSFDETVSDYGTTGGWAEIEYKNLKYQMPIGYNITNVLYETEDRLDFLMTNSIRGTLKGVSIFKE